MTANQSIPNGTRVRVGVTDYFSVREGDLGTVDHCRFGLYEVALDDPDNPGTWPFTVSEITPVSEPVDLETK